MNIDLFFEEESQKIYVIKNEKSHLYFLGKSMVNNVISL